MSLRGFHIIFITLSVLLSFAFAFFELRAYQLGGAVADGVVAGFSAAVGLALLVYGIWFISKPKSPVL